MSRRGGWPSIAVSVLVALFLLDRWVGADESRRPAVEPPPAPEMADDPAPEAEEVPLAPVVLPPPPAASAPLQAAPAPRRIMPLEPESAGAGREPPLAKELVPSPERAPETAVLVRPLEPAERAPLEVQRGALESPPTVSTASAPDAPPEPSPEAAAVDGSDADMVASGRALLRLLEHGSGPRVEIAWPGDTRERDSLFERFRRCHGMAVAVMDGRGRLYTADGPPGHAWDINLDRYSGFVRQSDRLVSRFQAAEVRAVRRRHPGLGGGRAVHVFPRAADAVLLGGLERLVGDGYGRAGAIHAVYLLAGGRVFVDDIRVEGKAVTGRIELSGTASCGKSWR